MSETLLGVIIWGIIASITSIVTLFYSHKKWKVEEKIKSLKEKRNRLELKYKEIHPKLVKWISENSYDIEMLSHFECSFPKKVNEQFQKLMDDKSNDPTKNKFHFLSMQVKMNESLNDIDKEIESILK